MPGYKKTQRGRPFPQSNYGRGPSHTAGECAERDRSKAWANPEREDSLQLARSKRKEELQAELYSLIEPQAMEVGYFHLSEDEYRPLNLSGNCIGWFKEVSDQHHVQLNQHETNPSIIVVRSHSPINIKKALAAMSILYCKQQYLESSENTTVVWRTPNIGIPASKRITFVASQNVQESRAKLTGEGEDIVPGTASEGEVSSFAKKMAPILQAEILKVAYMPYVVLLKMKIGLLKYSSIPAGSSLTLQQFDRLLTTRGSRLKSALDPRLGCALYHKKLLKVVGDFYQNNTRRLFHGGLPPRSRDEEIFMHTKDGKKVMIGIMNKDEMGVILPSGIWKTGALRKLESIRVACPDRRLDYEFAIETDGPGEFETQYSKLKQEVHITGTPSDPRSPYIIKFPRVNSCPDEITSTEIRTTERFPFRDTYYNIEITMVRRWMGMGTEGAHNNSTEVSFTCMDWYTKLGNWSDPEAEDPSKANMRELFFHKPTYEESLSQYLDYVTEVQQLLEKAKDIP